MYPQKRKRLPEIGMAVVCLLAIGLSLFSILSTNRMREMAKMIYDHPYTVSNEARAMRSRLLDMAGVYLEYAVWGRLGRGQLAGDLEPKVCAAI